MNLPEKKAKMALCVAASDIYLPFTEWPVYLMDRAIVDDKTLLPTEHQQILPYITLTRTVNGRKQVLHYSREGKGAEARLHGLLSIGFGGHVDTIPLNFSDLALQSTQDEDFIKKSLHATCLIVHLVLEALRELDEELPGFFLKQISSSENRILTAHEERPELFSAVSHGIMARNFLQLTSEPVHTVHLGMSIVLDCDKIPCNQNALLGEEGNVGKVEWTDLAQLLTDDERYIRLEGWSQAVLSRIFANDTMNPVQHISV
jgi:predicted NUDIX family phosphoesterase